MTTEEIVQETVEYYATNPRAVVPHGSSTVCVYDAPPAAEGGPRLRCAFGRCMTDDALARGGDTLGGVDVLAARCGVGLGYHDQLLRPEYRGHSLAFWKELQHLHDDDVNWRGGLLTPFGYWVARRAALTP